MIRLTAVIEVEGHAPRALTHESNARSITLGRDETADFQLPLSTISRHHARIAELDGIYTVEDLGSTHGTQVGGKPLAAGDKKVLRHGDIIELTRARVTVAIEPSKVASAAPGEGTQAIAARAVQGILGRLGDARGEGPYLRVLSGVDEGVRFELAGAHSEWTLGRSRDCECLLHDANVSRRHAQIKKDWNGFQVIDLGSRNGVLVNDKPIGKPRRLRDRDEITIGPVRLVFVDPDADLLDALKDVPGFAREESLPDIPLPADPEEAGRSAGELSAPGDPADELQPHGLSEIGAGAAPAGDEADEEAEALEAIDPTLLGGGGGGRPLLDYIIIGGVVLVAAAGILFAALVLL